MGEVGIVHIMINFFLGVYYFIRALFPALPEHGKSLLPSDSQEDQKNENLTPVTATSILYPHILPKIYSSIFMLYALHYKKVRCLQTIFYSRAQELFYKFVSNFTK